MAQMMQQLSGLDTSFLFLETSTIHMHVGSVLLLDPSTAKKPLTFDRLKELILQRIHLVPTFRRRLLNVPFDLDFPYWIEDEYFDIDFHVRHVAVPPPGGLKEITELASRLHSQPLDRSKPLWELYFVEGLGDLPVHGGGKVAVISKVHHAAIDGMSGTEIMTTMLDLSPEPRKVKPPLADEKYFRLPGALELLARAGGNFVKQPVRLGQILPRTIRSVFAAKALQKEGEAPPASPLQAPRTVFNHPITPHRYLAANSISLDDVKAIRAKIDGAKVNDVVLAIVSGAVRQYLHQYRDLPEQSLIAMCPISVRTEDQRGTAGNQVAMMLSTLATDCADPIDRLATIIKGTNKGKAQHKALGAKALMDWVNFATPAVAARAARLYSRLRLADYHNPVFNLVVTNVPGPEFPLYLCGAQVLANYGMAPIVDGMGLIVVVFSYENRMDFGITVCRELTPDIWHLAAALTDSLNELKMVVAQPDFAKKLEKARELRERGPQISLRSAEV